MSKYDFELFAKHMKDSWLAGTRKDDAIEHFIRTMKIQGGLPSPVITAAHFIYIVLECEATK